MGTAVERASAVSEIQQKAEGYGIPNSRVDGMSLLEVMRAAEEAIAHIRAGNGPYFLEVITYRFRGHSMGDPERYRQADEVRCWQENDPIGIYRKYLIASGLASAEELNAHDKQMEAETLAAVQFAENRPEPPPEPLFQHIYVAEPVEES